MSQRKLPKLRKQSIRNDKEKELQKSIPRIKKSNQYANSDEDDKEINRLEKLLGIDSRKRRRESALKLNKEYEMFEGISGDMGEFLLDLDRLSSTELDSSEGFDEVIKEETIENSETTSIDDEEVVQNNEDSNRYYVPPKGEDIYGRQIDGGNVKYVPPALRKSLDRNTVFEVNKCVNGLMNKLSEQTKDSIFISLQSMYSTHSINLMNEALKDYIFSICINDSQFMTSLIPIYAAVISALHFTVNSDIGSFFIETFTCFICSISASNITLSVSNVTSKGCNNCVLFLSYFYNFKLFSDVLVMDIIRVFVKHIQLDFIEESELSASMLHNMINQCGMQLRSDNEIELKSVLHSISQIHDSKGRLNYLLDMINEFQRNKSKREQNGSEILKPLKRWIGNMKTRTQQNGKFSVVNDVRLQFNLLDILNADKNGRWWRAGASWIGNDSKKDNLKNKPDNHVSDDKNKKLSLLAEKLHMNTNNRRDIFFAVMGSLNVDDAFENICKLNLKGSQEREVIKVIIECCAKEKVYNIFYKELILLLCNHNRQFRVTLQYAFWDYFKTFNDDSSNSERRCQNLSKLLLDLVVKFQLPLSVLKVLDINSTSHFQTRFLQDFFNSLFSDTKITREDLESVFDRVATSKDYQVTRDFLLLYLKRYFPLRQNEELEFKSRMKMALKTLQSMELLDLHARQ